MQIGSKLPLGSHQRVIRNSHIAYNSTIYIYFLDAKIQPLCICCSWLCLEETTTFFWFKTNWAHFGWFGDHNNSKQRQIEHKFWPQVVLTVVPMPFKAFCKTRIFTEAGSTHFLSYWSNFDLNLCHINIYSCNSLLLKLHGTIWFIK